MANVEKALELLKAAKYEHDFRAFTEPKQVDFFKAMEEALNEEEAPPPINEVDPPPEPAPAPTATKGVKK
jgi:hypothetical protein